MRNAPVICGQANPRELQEVYIAHALLLRCSVQASHVLQVGSGLASTQNALQHDLLRKDLQNDLCLLTKLLCDLQSAKARTF